MIPILPSRWFYGLLTLGMAIAFILALLSSVTLALGFLGIYDSILVILALWDGWQGRKRRVTVSRDALGKLSINRDNPAVLHVNNPKTGTYLQIEDGYPREFTASSDRFSLYIGNQAQEDLVYTVRPHQRGEFAWGDIYVRQLCPWRLAWYDWSIAAAQTVAVYPDLLSLRSLSIQLAIQNTGTMRQLRRLGQGTEFSELREYAQGDDTRLIDWKATARRSHPLVRVLEPEREQTLLILLDRGRLMTAQVEGIKRFDWGLNATLSLALAGLNRGDRVGIAVFDKTIHTLIPPTSGQHQLSRLIEQLTPIQPVLLEPDYFGAVTRLVTQQLRRALVVLITDIIDRTASAELLAALTRLTPRYLPFAVTLRDPQVDAIASHPAPETLTPAQPAQFAHHLYTRAVALDLLSQREVAFAHLKRQGVLVLDAPASQISDQLVNRYLRLKARNLL
ncbi:MAG: DUF58 domain-containing protein [Jaaginema sp. PMC 1079.18]|nr:DUF58 domain-containing protein [Jaaginema sp. PMC 1080.18]MEC4852320.1 DUF58 domain-containing protein [Jaaginema sp. PMC 1079.18]MEC4865346.1 DUF58 domain-containing protein [Jaaginema sp. PMC 1078.18]